MLDDTKPQQPTMAMFFCSEKTMARFANVPIVGNRIKEAEGLPNGLEPLFTIGMGLRDPVSGKLRVIRRIHKAEKVCTNTKQIMYGYHLTSKPVPKDWSIANLKFADDASQDLLKNTLIQ